MKHLLLVLLLLASPVAGQPTYDYRGICSGFCGPAAIAWATRDNLTDPLTLDRMREIGRLMDWQHHHGLGGLREDLQDSPSAGKMAVLKAGWRYRVRSPADVLNGVATPNRTVILIRPDSRNRLTGQHWVVLAGLRAGNVLLHWGNGTVREFSGSDFEEMTTKGSPDCIYETYRPTPAQKSKATIWNRLWDWFFKKIA